MTTMTIMTIKRDTCTGHGSPCETMTTTWNNRRQSLGWALLLAGCVLTGCRSMRELPPVMVAHGMTRDTTVMHTVSYDSIYVWNDRWVDRSRDTLTIREHEVEHRFKLLHDTVYRARADTIPVVKTVERVKPQPYVPWYMKCLSAVGILSVVLLLMRLIISLC